MRHEPNAGILKFQDGTRIGWEFVEHVPYEPSAYQNDEGIIVETTSETLYFISLETGNVYAQADDSEALTRLIDARCPEIDKTIKAHDAQMAAMEARWEEQYLR